MANSPRYSDTEFGRLNAFGNQQFSFRSHEIARINHLITNHLDLMRSSFAFRFYEFHSERWQR
jgi:hypothetical protein